MSSPSLLGLHEERFNTFNPTFYEKINIWHFISERVSAYEAKAAFVEDIELINLRSIRSSRLSSIQKDEENDSSVDLNLGV